VHLKVLPESWTEIRCERSSFKMAGLPSEDFPTLPEARASGGTEVPAGVLRSLIARTAFAITAEDARYYLAGALLVLDKDEVAMVATDGHRLSYARSKATLDVKEPQRVLVPRKAISELARLIEGEENVAFQEIDNHLVFSVGGRVLASKKQEGQFPAYEKVIGVTGDKVVKLSREAMTAGIRRVSLLSSERSRAIRLGLQKGQLELLASSPELGEAKESVPVEYAGAGVEVGFNAQYLLDFLAAAGADNVELQLKDAESQGLLRPEGSGDIEHRYVVMPMRF
jgi:DNA polymerase III subunit beta